MSLAGRRVVVTGADGFIGSHLTEKLVRAGAEVTAFCFYNSAGSLGWLDKSEPDVLSSLDVRLGDIRDARFVEQACQGASVVFHLAALIAIPYSYAAAESFIDTNVRGTLNVLEAVRRSQCELLVHASTSEVYGTPDSLPIVESHPLKAQSPYSASKIAADKLCESFHCSYGVPVLTLRPFNTYGPRQSARAIVPTILAQALSGGRTIHLGNLAPKRDLTFISDTVRGFVAAGDATGLAGRTIQLGTGRSESIAEMVRLASEICGVELQVEEDVQRLRPQASEVMVLQADPSLARELLGWSAKTTLEEGMIQTADWMRSNLSRYAADRYSI
ncbi:MAG: GDP-mannose 4,6-dehydratase [Gemmatimonadaceae bacterium]